MAKHGSTKDAAGVSTTRSFRKSFIDGFAVRIGEWLREAAEKRKRRRPTNRS